MNQMINEQLTLLERELSKLKKATDYIENSRKKSEEIVTELEKIQKNYSSYTDSLYNIYKESIENIKNESARFFNESVKNIISVSAKFDETSQNQSLELKNLIDTYKKAAEEVEKLIDDVRSLSISEKMDSIKAELIRSGKNIESVEANQSVQFRKLQVLVIASIVISIAGVSVSILMK